MVKVQRPGLRQLFDIDLENLEKIAVQLDKQDEATRDFKGIYQVGGRVGGAVGQWAAGCAVVFQNISACFSAFFLIMFLLVSAHAGVRHDSVPGDRLHRGGQECRPLPPQLPGAGLGARPHCVLAVQVGEGGVRGVAGCSSCAPRHMFSWPLPLLALLLLPQRAEFQQHAPRPS